MPKHAELVGCWAPQEASSLGCIVVEIRPDERIVGGLLANLLTWMEGRRGCKTRSSDIASSALRAHEQDDGSLTAEGSLATLDGEPQQITIRIQAGTRNAHKAHIVMGAREVDVALAPSPDPMAAEAYPFEPR